MITSQIEETDQKHIDAVDAFAYTIASYQAHFIGKKIDEYYLIYVKERPKYIPNWLYKLILKKVLVLANFKK